MNLEEKDKYIEEHLMLLSAETLRFMVADLASEADGYKKSLQNTVIVPGEQYDKLVAENEELKQLEKQYAESLGRLAQLCDTVCPYILATCNPHDDTTIYQCADEIMEYVDSVRP
jgi:hypothetical protein